MLDEKQLSVMKIADANKMGGAYSIEHYGYHGMLGINRKSAVKQAREAYEALWVETNRIHETNLEAIDNNKRIRVFVTDTMKAIGIPERWTEYEFKTSRSRNRTAVGKTAGFLSDLTKHVPVSDGFEAAKVTYERLIAACDKYEAETIRLETERQRKEEAEKARKVAERRSNFALVDIVNRYTMDHDSTWRDVVRFLLTRDKYLDLAHAMMETRCDWSDGFYRVENALGRFAIETEEDGKIYDCISARLDSDETDGRVFRDSEYGYDRLYGMVNDEQLVKDYNTACDFLTKESY